MDTKKDQIFPDWKQISKIKNYKKKDFEKLLNSYLENKKEVYKAIKSIKKEGRNFENTVLALESCDDRFEDIIHQLGVYSITHKNKEYRDNVNIFEKELSEKVVDIEYDKDIFRSLKEYQEGNYKKEKKNLDSKYGEGSIKLFEDSFKSYKKWDLIYQKQNKKN